MQVKTIQVGSFAVNCSVLVDSDRVYVVDPGAEPERILALLDSLSVRPTAILLTHAHFDHIGAVGELQRAYPQLPVVVGQADVKVFAHPMNQYPPDYPPVGLPANLQTSIAGFEILPTPGHTPGGVCYYLPKEQLLFSGDTLFCGSFGRTDLPGGDFVALTESLAKLSALPPDTMVIPGHGPTTTIARESGVDGVLTIYGNK